MKHDYLTTMARRTKLLMQYRFRLPITREKLRRKMSSLRKIYRISYFDPEQLAFILGDKKGKIDLRYLYLIARYFKVSQTYFINDQYNDGFTFEVPYASSICDHQFFSTQHFLCRMPYSDLQLNVPLFLQTFYICFLVSSRYQSPYDKRKFVREMAMDLDYERAAWIPFTNIYSTRIGFGEYLCYEPQKKITLLIAVQTGKKKLNRKESNNHYNKRILIIAASCESNDISGTYAITARRCENSYQKENSGTEMVNMKLHSKDFIIPCQYGGIIPDDAIVLHYLGSYSVRSKYNVNISRGKYFYEDVVTVDRPIAIVTKKSHHRSNNEKTDKNIK